MAYSLTTTLEASLLPNMQVYVDLYLKHLDSNLKEKSVRLPENLKLHFDIVWLDYARVVMTGLWKRLSPEQIEKYANAVGPSMITKSLDHVKFVIRRVHELLRVEQLLSKELLVCDP